jgi:hypothetical protein
MHKLTYKGKTRSAAGWAREIGVNASTIRWRIDRGWSVEDCLKKLVPQSERKLPRSHAIKLGMKIRRWEVVSDLGTAPPHYAREWLCRCECGTEKPVRQSALLNGDSSSCGCYGLEQRLKKTKTHGKSSSVEYKTWQRIIQRCHNQKDKSYPRYGGRGIKVCDRWRESFKAFLSDMGLRPPDKPTIERIKNDQGYSPDNCKWASYAEQNRNHRRNHHITANGETLLLQDWAERLGVESRTILERIKRGWSEQDAVTVPAYLNKRRKAKSPPKNERRPISDNFGLAAKA